MKAYEYILGRQTQWALSHGIPLVGSKGSRGRPAYTLYLRQNLFEPLSPDVYECLSKGDGNEILGSLEYPSKMQAVHSSSALGVNSEPVHGPRGTRSARPRAMAWRFQSCTKVVSLSTARY